MGSALTGHSIQSSYLDVCQLGNSGAGITASLLAICDGAGTASSLQISTAQSAVTPNAVASKPPFSVTGNWFSGGSATTTKPQVLVEPTGTVSTGWSTDGTGLGINAAAGFVGRMIDLQLAGVSKLSVEVGALVAWIKGNFSHSPWIRIGDLGGGTTVSFVSSDDTTQGAAVQAGSVRLTNIGGANSYFASSAPGGAADVSFYRGAAGVWTPGTGDNTGIGWVQDAGCARNTADVTNATTTFATLPDLTITVKAGRKYFGKLIVKCNNDTAAEGIKFDFNGGTATMTSFWAAASELVGGTTVLGTAISTSLAGVINYTTITGETIIEFNISFVVNAAGTLIPRFAENSHAAGTATVELGSFINLTDSPN